MYFIVFVFYFNRLPKKDSRMCPIILLLYHPVCDCVVAELSTPPSSKYCTPLFKVPHHPLQSTTPPSSKYNTTLFKVLHTPLQSTIPPSSKYHTTIFKVLNTQYFNYVSGIAPTHAHVHHFQLPIAVSGLKPLEHGAAMIQLTTRLDCYVMVNAALTSPEEHDQWISMKLTTRIYFRNKFQWKT